MGHNTHELLVSPFMTEACVLDRQGNRIGRVLDTKLPRGSMVVKCGIGMRTVNWNDVQTARKVSRDPEPTGLVVVKWWYSLPTVC